MARVIKTQIENQVSLVHIIGYEQEVSNLTINNITMGNSDGQARLVLSSDKQCLYVYLDCEYSWECLVLVEEITTMSFTMCEEFIEIEF